MAKGREKSDGRIVPEGRRKAIQTRSGDFGGGKAVTVSQQAEQLELFTKPAESPRGDAVEAVEGRPSTAPPAAPLLGTSKRTALPTMMEEVAKESNLRKALKKILSNDGAPGPDGRSVKWVRQHFDTILPTLRRELLEGSFRPGLIRRVWIPKLSGDQRGLGIPDVIDRIVQQAVQQRLTPLFTPSFHPSSHGFIEGRSCHTAIQEAIGYVDEGRAIVVDLDLEKFFDQVNHQRLMARLEQKVEDRLLLDLIRRMLKAGIVMPDGVVVTNEEGVPQGGPLSPLLSNIVLTELDWELDRRGLIFVRYADDCNIYVRSERAGNRVMESITRFIERRLRLKVNASKSAVARPEDRHFLGFRLYRDPLDGSVEVLLSKRSVKRIKAKIREMTPRNWGQSMKACIQDLNGYLKGWIGFFWIVTDAEERLLGYLETRTRRRLRAIKLRHWGRKRVILRNFLRAGVSNKTAGRYVYGTQNLWWALSRCDPVHRALPNSYFVDLGLMSLKERRQEILTRHTIAHMQQMLPFG